MEVRRVRAGDAHVLRDVRLRALADAPTAFGSSLAEARAHPDDHWTGWAARAADDPAHATMLAVDREVVMGMAGGFVMEGDDAGSAMLYGMWVDPARRGSGLAARLVDAVVGWARTTEVERLILWVTEHNARARRFYERYGFTLIDGTMPLRSHPEHTLVRMALPLR